MKLRRPVYAVLTSAISLALLLAACTTPAPPAAGTPGPGPTVEVTRVVTVEVTQSGPAQTAATALPAVATVAAAGNTLKTVTSRGKLLCGGNPDQPGFGYLDPATQQFAGFDIDFCKAVAAAIFDDPTKLEVVATTSTTRFTALQSGEIDVLIRNATMTLSRNSALGLDFGPTTFYDGQGMMVTKKSGITDLKGLAGGTICVGQGTTSEKNLADVMTALNVKYTPLVLADAPSMRDAYEAGRCDGMTDDKSSLIANQSLLKDPTAHVILPGVTMSKEPLTPAVRYGDDNWAAVVRWTVYCTFEAEELSVTSQNIDQQLASADPVVQNMLGVQGDLGKGLGLTNDFCERVIRRVGNYGEIYNRNLGPGTRFSLDRGLNNLWTKGGLLYSPPFN